MITEKLLFAAHRGTVGGHRQCGIIMEGRCLPIACSHGSWSGKDGDRPHADAGICALWEATGDVENFFSALGFGVGIEDGPGEAGRHRRPTNGLWVYTVEYDEATVTDEDNDEWPWLCGGTLRQPTVEELKPLTRRLTPWGGIVL
jgi:hypothetical protein